MKHAAMSCGSMFGLATRRTFLALDKSAARASCRADIAFCADLFTSGSCLDVSRCKVKSHKTRPRRRYTFKSQGLNEKNQMLPQFTILLYIFFPLNFPYCLPGRSYRTEEHCPIFHRPMFPKRLATPVSMSVKSNFSSKTSPVKKFSCKTSPVKLLQ